MVVGMLLRDSISALSGDDRLRPEVRLRLWKLAPPLRDALHNYVTDVARKLALDSPKLWNAVSELTSLPTSDCERIRRLVDQDLRGLELADRMG